MAGNILQIPFTGGLDEKIDDKILPIGKLKTMENCFQKSTGAIRKRWGYTNLAKTKQAGGSISAVTSLMATKRALYVNDGSSLYARDTASDKWAEVESGVGDLSLDFNHISSYIGLLSQGINVAVSASGDYIGFKGTIHDSQGNVVDDSAPATFFAMAGNSTGDVIGAFTANAGTLSYYAWAPSTGWSSAVTVSSTLAASNFYEWIAVGPTLYVSVTNTTGNVEVISVPADASSGGTLVYTGSAGVFPTIAYESTGSGYFWLAYQSGGSVYVVRSDLTGTTSFSPVATASYTATTEILSMGLVAEDDPVTTFRLYFTREHPTTVTPREGSYAEPYFTIETLTVDTSGTASSTSDFKKHAMMKCRPFRSGGKPMLLVSAHGDVTDVAASPYTAATPVLATDYLVDGDGEVRARMFVDEAAYQLPPNEPLMNPAQDASGRPVFLGLRKTGLSETGFFVGANAYAITVRTDIPSRIVGEFSGAAIMSGAIARAVSSGKVLPYGHVRPVDLSLSQRVSSGSIANGTYSIVATYCFFDKLGNIWESAPSEAFSITTTGSNNVIDIVVPVPDIASGAVDFQIRVYRTIDSGTIYYLEGVVEPSAGDFQTISVSAADANLKTLPVLYATGGVVENTPLPGVYAGVVGEVYGYIVPEDDRESVWQSKPLSRNYLPEFSNQLTLHVKSGGDITALGLLDGRLVVFKERKVFLLEGEGFNALGQGGYLPPREISTDIGAVDRSPVVNTPLGLVFQSPKGIYLLSRSLELQYIGAAVESYNAKTVNSIVNHPSENLVIFTFSDDTVALAWDYYHQSWSVWTNHDAAAAVAWNGKYYLAESDGTVREESTTYTDNGASYAMTMRTGWIAPGGPGAFCRVKRLALLGEWKSTHTGTLKTFQDWRDGSAEEVQTDSLVATSSVDPYQWRVHMGSQKCNSVMFEFSEDGDQAVELNGLTLEWMPKRGLNKLAANRSL